MKESQGTKKKCATGDVLPPPPLPKQNNTITTTCDMKTVDMAFAKDLLDSVPPSSCQGVTDAGRDVASSTSSCPWKRVCEVFLMKKIRDNRLLWDIKKPQDCNESVIRVGYDKVAEHLKQKYPELSLVTGDQCRKKHWTLVSLFLQEQKRNRMVNSGCEKKVSIKWECLEDFITHRDNQMPTPAQTGSAHSNPTHSGPTHSNQTHSSPAHSNPIHSGPAHSNPTQSSPARSTIASSTHPPTTHSTTTTLKHLITTHSTTTTPTHSTTTTPKHLITTHSTTTTPTHSTTTTPKHLITTHSTTTTPKHLITTQSTTTTPKHLITAQSTTTTPKHLITAQSTTTTPKHLITAQSTTTTPKHLITAQSTTTTPKHLITAHSTTTTPKHLITAHSSPKHPFPTLAHSITKYSNTTHTNTTHTNTKHTNTKRSYTAHTNATDSKPMHSTPTLPHQKKPLSSGPQNASSLEEEAPSNVKLWDICTKEEIVLDAEEILDTVSASSPQPPSDYLPGQLEVLTPTEINGKKRKLDSDHVWPSCSTDTTVQGTQRTNSDISVSLGRLVEATVSKFPSDVQILASSKVMELLNNIHKGSIP